ncbi:hypothetical protein CHUAL_007716 [Chamberlinius hualienensis]
MARSTQLLSAAIGVILCLSTFPIVAHMTVTVDSVTWKQTIDNFTSTHLKCSPPTQLQPEFASENVGNGSWDDLSSTLLYLAATGCKRSLCGASDNRTCIEEQLIDLQVVDDNSISVERRLDALNSFLRKLSDNYRPSPTKTTSQCETADVILKELQLNKNQSVFKLLVNHLLRGDCFITSSNDHATGYTWSESNWSNINASVFEKVIGDVNSISKQCNCQSNRCKRHVAIEATPSICLNGKDLFIISDQDKSDLLSREELIKYVCPPLMDQLLSSGNIGLSETNTNATGDGYSSNSIAYIYGTVSVTIISLCSIFGVVIIPCMRSRGYSYVMTALIGMGFGILTGDAILHLLPQAVGLHDIIHEGNDAPHTELIPPYLFKCIGVLAAIYALFLFESLSSIVMPGHSHDHGHQETKDGNGHMHGNGLNQLTAPVTVLDVKKSLSQEVLEIGENGLQTSSNSSLYGESSTSGEIATVELAAEDPIICCNLKSLALVITLGDTFHNFADGLIIGAAFASGLQGGLSSSLAIFCHEIPHELGDFAILLSTGLSRRNVIFINILSSLSSFAGLYIGIAIGSDQSAVQWALAITAGLFLFVALGDMMPELKKQSVESPWKQVLIQNIAVLSGMIFMAFMSIYEDEIRW